MNYKTDELYAIEYEEYICVSEDGSAGLVITLMVLGVHWFMTH
jgi:hypothetical protein